MPVGQWAGPDNFPTWIAYAKGQREIGETTGYEHWQLVVWSRNNVRLSRLRGWLPDAHWEPTRSDAAIAYVWKEQTRVPGSQFEYGEFPHKRNSKTDWESVKELAVANRIDEIPSDIQIRYYSTLKKIAEDHMVPAFRDNVRAKFFFGPTRLGKSRRAWHEAGVDAYIKCGDSKWWDGYKGEDCVIIDELR